MPATTAALLLAARVPSGVYDWFIQTYGAGEVRQLAPPDAYMAVGLEMAMAEGRLPHTGTMVYPNGTKLWVRRGKLHREDGPAAVYSDGRQHWYRDNVEIDPPKETP